MKSKSKSRKEHTYRKGKAPRVLSHKSRGVLEMAESAEFLPPHEKRKKVASNENAAGETVLSAENRLEKKQKRNKRRA